MKSKILPALIMLIMFLTGCREDGEEQAINETYLDSEEYQEFDQESIKERSFRSDEATAFERILSNLLIHPETNELELPAKIDSVSLESYIDSSLRFDLKRSMLNEPTSLDFAYYPVGKTRQNEIQTLFFLIEKRSVYDDRELAVATFNDSSMIEVQSLAEFVKTLSLRVQSTVHIDRSLNIVSDINRQTLYPIPQEYTTTYRYTIGSEGKIQEEVLSEND